MIGFQRKGALFFLSLLNLAARAAHPERWSGDTRNWHPVTLVSLNPERRVVREVEKIAA
jgi:putative transposase